MFLIYLLILSQTGIALPQQGKKKSAEFYCHIQEVHFIFAVFPCHFAGILLAHAEMAFSL